MSIRTPSFSSHSRRSFLRSAAVAGGTIVFGRWGRAQSVPVAKVIQTKVISQQPQYYHGWPTLTRRRNSGQLVVAYSGGREGHICPFGRVEIMVSNDQGENWSWPQVVMDSPIDDRDAGVLATVMGTLLVTSFTSLAYEPILAAAQKRLPPDPAAWPEARLNQWLSANNRLTAEQRQAELGVWMTRSTDGGVTWSARYPSLINSPHGPIQLRDGRLLYPGKELWTGNPRIGVCESLDDGLTWHWLSEIPTRPGDQVSRYHELHGVDAGDGSVVVHIRNENPNNNRETLQTVSRDGGKTWSEPQPIGVWGLPSHLRRLKGGQLLMSYGYRRAPLGNQARVSNDQGRTWSEPVMISTDGSSGDLGYPSTVELEDGSLVTVWYETMKGSARAVLRQAHWTLV